MTQVFPEFGLPQGLPDLNTQQGPQAKPKGGMFGGGKFGVAQALAAALAGFAARRNPVPLQMLMGAMQQKQQTEAEEEKYQQHRNDQFDDWTRQQTWKLEHPEIASPHYFESNSGDVYTVVPGQEPQQVFKDPLRYKLVPNGLGGVVPVDIEQLMRGGAPAGPVGRLTPINGGPTPQASGGFPGPY